MPKQKTKSSAQKRFKLTASGKVKRKQSGMRHNLSKKKKTTKAKRSLIKNTLVSAADQPRIKKMLS